MAAYEVGGKQSSEYLVAKGRFSRRNVSVSGIIYMFQRYISVLQIIYMSDR